MSKFRIPKIPSSEQRTIRFPDDLIEEVEKYIEGTDYTFSSFIRKAVEMALKDLEEQEIENHNKQNNKEEQREL